MSSLRGFKIFRVDFYATIMLSLRDLMVKVLEWNRIYRSLGGEGNLKFNEIIEIAIEKCRIRKLK